MMVVLKIHGAILGEFSCIDASFEKIRNPSAEGPASIFQSMMAKLKPALKNVLGKLGLQLVVLPKALLLNRLRPSNSRLIRQYLASDGPKKLHLGSGSHVLPRNLLKNDYTHSKPHFGSD